MLADQLVQSDYDLPHHLDYELVEGYVDDKLDKVDREAAEAHLQVCVECSEEVTDLRESLATMHAAPTGPNVAPKSVRERLLGFISLPVFANPLRVTALVALAVLAVIALVIVMRMKTVGPAVTPSGKDLIAESIPTPIQSPRNSAVANVPSPTPPPRVTDGPSNKTVIKSPDGLLVLNDRTLRVTFTGPANLSVWNPLPRESQQAVKEALVAETIKKRAVLEELATWMLR